MAKSPTVIGRELCIRLVDASGPIAYSTLIRR
jgi:hypothetical protein